MPKYIRHVGQVEALLHQYEDEIRKINRLIEASDDERTTRILKELHDDHVSAKRRLENFLNENSSIFK